MKKFFLVIGILFLAAFNAIADEYTLFTGDAYRVNTATNYLDETQFRIKYDDSRNVYYLYTSNWMNKIWIYLSEDDLQTIRYAMRKYQDWVKIANEKQVEIDKEIPDSTIRTKVSWKSGVSWYRSSEFKLYFDVCTLKNTQCHRFIISSNIVTASSNEFVDVKLDTLYFEEKEVADFLAGISENNISAAKKEHNKKKEAQDLFN